jgi:SAM-dependent methyltransferase
MAAPKDVERGVASAVAFDAIASRYDETLAPPLNPVADLIRVRVHGAFTRHFVPGSALLEIGCGTGTDTAALARRGFQLIATDPAAGMIAQARAKVAASGQLDAVRFLEAGIEDLARTWPSRRMVVDGVFSNLAPLNCTLSLDPVRTLLESALPRGGRFVAVVLPRVCPLEVAFSLARGDVRTALRRFHRHPIADVEGHRFPMRYYGAGDFDRALGPSFRRIETRSLGLWLPPLAFGPKFARSPRLLGVLAAVEGRTSNWAVLRRLGDHVLLTYERT